MSGTSDEAETVKPSEDDATSASPEPEVPVVEEHDGFAVTEFDSDDVEPEPERLEKPQPRRVQLNFFAATEVSDGSDVEAVADALIREGLRRGFFYDIHHVEVVERSDLYPDDDYIKIIDGYAPPDGQST